MAHLKETYFVLKRIFSFHCVFMLSLPSDAATLGIRILIPGSQNKKCTKILAKSFEINQIC